MKPKSCKQVGCPNKTQSKSGYCWQHSKFRMYNRRPGERAPRSTSKPTPARTPRLKSRQIDGYTIRSDRPIPFRPDRLRMLRQLKIGESVELDLPQKHAVATAKKAFGKGNFASELVSKSVTIVWRKQ